MNTNTRISPLEPGGEHEAARLVETVFAEHTAPTMSEQGRTEFMKYVGPKAIVERLGNGGYALAARSCGTMVGYIELCTRSHICQFFVRTELQRRGMGRQLLHAAVRTCLDKYPETTALTVNASLNAVSAYEKMGFVPTDEEQEMNGIRFRPMRLKLA